MLRTYAHVCRSCIYRSPHRHRFLFSLSQSHSLMSRCCAPVTTRWRRFLSHGRWFYVGWSVFTVGNVANFISLSFTPQSLLAGLGSSQFLMNAVCEWYFNGRNVTARMVKATVAIIIGNTLIVAFASHESPKLTVDELLSGQTTIARIQHGLRGDGAPQSYSRHLCSPLSLLFSLFLSPANSSSSLPSTSTS